MTNLTTTTTPKLYPQADITLVNGNYLPFIPSHNILPVGTVAKATTRTGEKSFIKLLAPHSKTPLGYLYNFKPVKTLSLSIHKPVRAGEKFSRNNIPYEVLSATPVPAEYDEDNLYHYILEVTEITSMLEPEVKDEATL